MDLNTVVPYRELRAVCIMNSDLFNGFVAVYLKGGIPEEKDLERLRSIPYMKVLVNKYGALAVAESFFEVVKQAAQQ